MSPLQQHPTTDAALGVPSQRQRPDRERLSRAAEVIEDWLETQEDPDDEAVIHRDADDLRRISTLALADADETELAAAVQQARDDGWAWGPIAMVLGQHRDHARRRWS